MMKEDTKRWIKKAEDDLRVAKRTFRMKEYVYARYPDASSGKEDMKTISQQFIKDAEAIMKWAKSKL